jgi:signal transduction histidine kinase
VRWTADGVEVRSVNRTESRNLVEPGRGLTGMRHRAEMLGGTFEADGSGGCFDVRVTIPSRIRA